MGRAVDWGMEWGTTGGATVANVTNDPERCAPLTIEGLRRLFRA